MTAFYNENDAVAAYVLASLSRENLIAPGYVDSRSIKDIQPHDLEGFTQCHFFAGAGIWSVAARLARWPDDLGLWSASLPCQPFSVAGKGAGLDDERHLWPDFFRLVRARRPARIVGEQVAGTSGEDWFNGVRADLAREGYETRVVVLPSLAVDAPNIRLRQYWCAVADTKGFERRSGFCEDRAISDGTVAANGDGGDQLLANANGGVRERRTDFTFGSAQGRTSAQRLDGRAIGAGHMVNAASIGRGERQPEPEIQRGRATSSSADAPGVTHGDAFGAGLEGHAGDDGGARGRQEPHRSDPSADGGDMADAAGDGRQQGVSTTSAARHGDFVTTTHRATNGSFWSDHEWIICHDAKARRTKPGIRLLVDGMAGRIHLWRLAGNSINAVLAAEVLAALLETEC